MSVTKTAIAPEHDQTLARLTKAMEHFQRAAKYLQQLQHEADQIESYGLERGKCHWKGNYLSLYYRSEDGKRVERYVGCKPEAIAEVQAGQARYQQWLSAQTTMLELRQVLEQSAEMSRELYSILEWY